MAQSSGITVAICTHNRLETLQLALTGLFALEPATFEWSVLVVDNASTDGTLEYAQCVCETHGAVLMRVVEEQALGLSVARNRALQEADHDIVAFIDDDTIVTPGWLNAVASCFEQHPCAAVVGGPITVKWMGGEPQWLHPDLLEYFSSLDHGSEDCRLTYPMSPYGANYIVKRSVALDVGGFRTDLGNSGKSLAGGEETELSMRIEEAGWEIWYCANAPVDHLIQSARVTESWLMRRAYSGGLTTTLLKKPHFRPWQQPGLIIEDLRWLRYAVAQRRSRADEPTRVRSEARYWNARGRCRGWLSSTQVQSHKPQSHGVRQTANG
jgi:glycosyltransferase involved in cell wall biosynthesis